MITSDNIGKQVLAGLVGGGTQLFIGLGAIAAGMTDTMALADVPQKEWLQVASSAFVAALTTWGGYMAVSPKEQNNV